jgi:hypothetical protein
MLLRKAVSGSGSEPSFLQNTGLLSTRSSRTLSRVEAVERARIALAQPPEATRPPGAGGESPGPVDQPAVGVHDEREQRALLFVHARVVLAQVEPQFPGQFLTHRLELEYPAVHGVPPHAAVPALGRPLAEPAVPLLPRQRRHGTAGAKLDGLDEIGARLPLFPGRGRARDIVRLDHLKHPPERHDSCPVPITRPHGFIVQCVFIGAIKFGMGPACRGQALAE